MAKVWGLASALLLAAAVAYGADPAGGVVRDYETRLEEVAREIQDIRREVDALVQDVVQGETGRVLVFLEGAPAGVREKGVSLVLDGKAVVSRPLTAAELDVLTRGLPLELFDVRLSAGDHKIAVGALGAEAGEASTQTAARGKTTSWIAKAAPPPSAVEWRSE